MRSKQRLSQILVIAVTFLFLVAKQVHFVIKNNSLILGGGGGGGSQQHQDENGVYNYYSHDDEIYNAPTTKTTTTTIRQPSNNNTITTTISTRPAAAAAAAPPPLDIITPLNMTTQSINNNKNMTNDFLANKASTLSSLSSSLSSMGEETQPHCALMFFGLPRSFDLLVLPSIEKNILIPNKRHRCDIFVHFYLVENEESGRSGIGGTIDPTEVLQLKDSVHALYYRDDNDDGDEGTFKNIPLVSFTNDTEAEFHRKRGKQIEKYRSTKDKDGNYLYFPWKEPSYKYPSTMDNIVKQWHSIDAVWNLMTQTSQQLHRNYTRVAMLRNDVVYMTPFDIYKRGIDTPIDTNNTDVLIPNWARYPINDRMIYGPHDAVRIWATERFDRLETHIQNIHNNNNNDDQELLGWGMHSERFLNAAIFPAIRQLGYGVEVDPDICFFRARADGSTWITDCTTAKYGRASGFRKVLNVNAQALVEAIVERPCVQSTFKDKIKQVHCPKIQQRENITTTTKIAHTNNDNGVGVVVGYNSTTASTTIIEKDEASSVASNKQEPSNIPPSASNELSSSSSSSSRCALLFFGLPRSFELLVLPSIIQNILIPNQQYRCDIFVHFYVIQSEASGRSGSGGTINPMEVFKLQDAVRDLYGKNDNNDSKNSNIPLVRFTNDTDAEFHRKRGREIEKYRNTTDANGNYVYFPWKLATYKYPSTMDNIVKQWHSIQSVWEDMEQTSNQLHRNYTRVAMLRSDVVYVTPFDLYKKQHPHAGGVNTTTSTTAHTFNEESSDVFIPNFAKYPINDRMVYGPRDAVRIWATERFERLETHVRTFEPGMGMHSERFLNFTIFPAIEALGYRIVTDPDICFFRARADGSAWISDCTTKRNGSARGFDRHSKSDAKALVEAIVKKPCRKSLFKPTILQVNCLPPSPPPPLNDVNNTTMIKSPTG